MWAEFSRDFDWRPHPGQTVGYLDGMRCCVTREAMAAAAAAGAAVEIGTPVREIAAKLTADPFWRGDFTDDVDLSAGERPAGPGQVPAPDANHP